MFNNLMFLCSAALTIIGAYSVVYTKNLMHACIYLLASFFGVSGLYACIGADFLAATQLVVYAGGVVILMLFAVMLTGGSAEKRNRFGLTKIPSMGSTQTFAAGLSSAIVMAMVLLNIFAKLMKANIDQVMPSNEMITVEKIGFSLATDHILAFEVSSVLLLGALIGAAIISRPRREVHD